MRTHTVLVEEGGSELSKSSESEDGAELSTAQLLLLSSLPY